MTRYAKKHKRMSHFIESVPEEVQTLDLLGKDLKFSMLNMFNELKENIS